MSTKKIIGPFTQLLTFSDLPIKGALSDSQLPVIENGYLLIENDTIGLIGQYHDFKTLIGDPQIDFFELAGENICLPGYVDAHTHICFGGERSKDYAMRNAGKSYLEIAAEGGGIWDTVSQTRVATQGELEEGILSRANTLLQSGITTVEVKSGYGLSIDEELKMLRAINNANRNLAQDLIPTCLAAHILPKDFEGNAEAYLDEVIHHLFPTMKSEGLSNRIDAFVETGAFSTKDVDQYFRTGKSMGFDLTVHADQFHPEGSMVAIHHKAMSADHLEAITEKEIIQLAKSNVVATALPGASIGLGAPFTPARALLDKGCCLAIASDWNPGSAPMGDLLVQASVLATFEKLTNAEVLAAITYRAAAALGLNDRGRLAKGMLADFCVYPVKHFNEVCYYQGMLKPKMVWKNGNKIFSSSNN